MVEPGWLTIVPPLAAIILAIFTRQVIPSLFVGVWMGWTVMRGYDPLAGLAEGLAQLVRVFEDGYNTKVILFSALVGSLITLTQRSGGVEGFVRWMQSRKMGTTPRSAGLVAFFTGLVVFVESSITCLVVGSVARPLTDRVKMAREKLAYICDSTSAPVCILIPLNAWGAYIMGLLALQGIDKPLKTLLTAIPLNFYAWVALIVVLVVILFDWNFGPMRKAEERARTTGRLLSPTAVPMIADEVVGLKPKEDVPLRSRNMFVPLAMMILMMPFGLYVTGHEAIANARADAQDSLPALVERRVALEEDIAALRANPLADTEALKDAIVLVEADLEKVGTEIADAERNIGLTVDFFSIMGEGSGSTAVFWAVLAAIVAGGVMYRIQGIFNLNEIMNLVLKGAGGLIPMAVIMILAFAINSTCNEMGTGKWVAGVAQRFLAPGFVPLVLFLVSCFIAFSTGTSWGTFGIMMPIGVPLALASGDASLAMAVAAILGGGVFGDHCSPISDTTVISSMATASDHIDHVRTQLPYALVAAGVASAVYLVLGLIG